MSDRVILHCDLNNFFASVEMIKNPQLRGKAIAVCGDPAKRHGIVLAKSELAKKFGVKTGMPIWEARQLCPDIIIVATNHADYGHYSRIVRDVYYRFTDKVESFGSDECFLDVTASLPLFKMTPGELADEIRRIVHTEIGLTVSVGVSWNKTYAKLGSDLKKPDATTVISRENYHKVVFPLAVSEMIYVGRNTARLLERLNVRTIGDLAGFDPKILAGHIGINAYRMVEMARGDDPDQISNFEYRRVVKSVGNGTTLSHNLTTLKEVEQVIYLLSEEVAFRTRKNGVKGHTISLSVRNTGLEWTGAQESLREATSSSQTICRVAMNIFTKIWHPRGAQLENLTSPVMSLRVAISNLTTEKKIQLSLFDDDSEEKNDKISAIFDDIRRKYGVGSVMFATGLGGKFKLHFDVADETD